MPLDPRPGHGGTRPAGVLDREEEGEEVAGGREAPRRRPRTAPILRCVPEAAPPPGRGLSSFMVRMTTAPRRGITGGRTTAMMNDPMSTIEWDGPAETWTTPLTTEQVVRLTTRHAMADDQMIAIVAFGPERPDCISALPDPSYFHESDPGDTWQVRFGRMPLAAYQNLPEHEGW